MRVRRRDGKEEREFYQPVPMNEQFLLADYSQVMVRNVLNTP